VREPRFESHRGRLCISRRPLRYAALGTGCALTAVPRSTKTCITPESLNRVTASAGVRVGLSPLSGDPIWHVSCRSGKTGLHYPCEPLDRAYFTYFTHTDGPRYVTGSVAIARICTTVRSAGDAG